MRDACGPFLLIGAVFDAEEYKVRRLVLAAQAQRGARDDRSFGAGSCLRRRLRRYFFGASLLAEFLEEFVLA
jgi:hypothetical protein